MSHLMEPHPAPARWHLIEQAVHARADWVHAYLAAFIGRASMANERARALAEEAGIDNPNATCPRLLEDIAELALAFDVGQTRARESERVESALLACDWQALNLPTPETLLAELLASGSTSVDGTLLTWESALGVTWYTNAYGIDGALCGTPDLAVMERFLIDTARGVEYGPIPH